MDPEEQAAVDRAVAEVEAEFAPRIAAAQKERDELLERQARLKEDVRRIATDHGIEDALRAAGVPRGIEKGAVALLRDRLKTELDERDYSVFVAGPHGRTSVAHAVNTWLATDGASFKTSPAPPEGIYTDAIRRLRSELH